MLISNSEFVKKIFHQRKYKVDWGKSEDRSLQIEFMKTNISEKLSGK